MKASAKRNVRTLPVQIESVIHQVRAEKVILDVDLAGIYGVETRALNQAVKRNKAKFPHDFMFQLTRTEAEELQRSRSQFVILNAGETSNICRSRSLNMVL